MAKVIELEPDGMKAWIASAKRTLGIESEAMARLIADLDGPLGRAFGEAIRLIKTALGRVAPTGMAPTTSTLLQLAMGDALALALLEERGFNAAQFKTFHPGGLLGAALTHVKTFMHKQPRLPLVAPETPMAEALVIMTQKSFG